MAVGARASNAFAADHPVILAVDNSPLCIASLVGLMIAGFNVLLVEHENSYFDDIGSAIHSVAAVDVVTPVTQEESTVPSRYQHWTFDELTAPSRTISVGVAGNSPAILQLTSGTTGEQKIAHRTLTTVLRAGALYRDAFRVTQADTILAPVPLAHSFGLTGGLTAALDSGATLMTFSPFRLQAVLGALSAGTGTVLLGTPLLFELLASSSLACLPPRRLRTLISCGGPLAIRTAAKVAQRLGSPVRQAYGSTETGLIACQSEGDGPWGEGAVGRPVPGVQWRIRCDGEEDMHDGAGTLFVKTTTMFTRYITAVDTPSMEDGFHDTGDVAWADEDGTLYLVGRKATFVNIGGRKINPERIERVIREHCQAVREVFVYGLERTDGTEEMHAALVLDPPVLPGDILADCRSSLLPYEIPRHVHVLDHLPRTAAGKLKRREAARLCAEHLGD